VVTKYRTASTRLEAQEWENYKQLCEQDGLTPFKDLQGFIKERLKIERTTEGLDEGSKGNIQGGSGGDTESITAFRKEWGDCPFC